MKTAVVLSVCLLGLPATGALAAFQCDFDGYEASDRFFALTADIGRYYDGSLGLIHYGSKEVHLRLQEEARKLELDPSRTPLVSADFQSARLDVFYCAREQCTIEEQGYAALNACRSKLGARSCVPYAIRVGDDVVCTVLPSLNNKP